MKKIRVADAEVEYTDDGCITRFDDGTSYGAQPHYNAHYHVISHRLGYGDDVMSYAREHEVCHLIAEQQFGTCGVIRLLASEQPIEARQAAVEETMVMMLQRWFRSHERPIIGGIDWDALKRDFLEMMNNR